MSASASLTHVSRDDQGYVEASVSISGMTTSAFDNTAAQTAFRNAVADTARVSVSDVSIMSYQDIETKTTALVISFRVYTPADSTNTPDNISQLLQQSSTFQTNLISRFADADVSLEIVEFTVTVSEIVSQSSTPAKSSKHSNALGAILGGIFGAAAFAGVVVLVVVKRRKQIGGYKQSKPPSKPEGAVGCLCLDRFLARKYKKSIVAGVVSSTILNEED